MVVLLKNRDFELKGLPQSVWEPSYCKHNDDFRLLMKEETVSLAKNGIPLYENERGEIKIDKDKLLEDS